MQFNGHSDEQDIVHAIVDATGLSATVHIKRITRAANEAVRIIRSWIFEAYGGWQYDDGNHVDLPSATTALVASQQKYNIPPDAMTMRKASYKDEAGDWNDLDLITLEDIAARGINEAEFESTPGEPRYYRPYAGIVKLYPAPNYSQIRSLRLMFDRGSVQFASTDTTKTPGFASEFHGAVPTGASLILAEDKTLKNRPGIEKRWMRYEEAIKGFYKKRLSELAPEQPTSERSDPADEAA